MIAAPKPLCDSRIPHTVNTHAWTTTGQELYTRDRAIPHQLVKSKTLTCLLSQIQTATCLPVYCHRYRLTDYSSILLLWLFCMQSKQSYGPLMLCMYFKHQWPYVITASSIFVSPAHTFHFRGQLVQYAKFHTLKNKSRHDSSKNNTNSRIHKISQCIKPRAIPVCQDRSRIGQ